MQLTFCVKSLLCYNNINIESYYWPFLKQQCQPILGASKIITERAKSMQVFYGRVFQILMYFSVVEDNKKMSTD